LHREIQSKTPRAADSEIFLKAVSGKFQRALITYTHSSH
jgi:hypothetical protein